MAEDPSSCPCQSHRWTQRFLVVPGCWAPRGLPVRAATSQRPPSPSNLAGPSAAVGVVWIGLPCSPTLTEPSAAPRLLRPWCLDVARGVQAEVRGQLSRLHACLLGDHPAARTSAPPAEGLDWGDLSCMDREVGVACQAAPGRSPSCCHSPKGRARGQWPAAGKRHSSSWPLFLAGGARS